MNIYGADNGVLFEIVPDDNSYRYRAIRGDDVLVLKYSLEHHIELPVGCYVLFQGDRYTLLHPESFKMHHSLRFEYTVTFDAPQGKSKMWKFRNPIDGRLQFSLTARPIEHLAMLLDNLNMREAGWTIGDCIEDVERVVTYDYDYCWDAFDKIATVFNTEFEFKGKEISLHRVEYYTDDPLEMSYGKGRGFKSGVSRNNADTPPIEILYVQGGDRNIDRGRYGSSTLHLPIKKGLAYDGKYFNDEAGFDAIKGRLYMTDELGQSICRADKTLTSGAEESLDCTHIYPRRIGTVTNVEVENEEKGFYNFADNSIVSILNYQDFLIAGEKMSVIFQTGMLAGREFEVSYHHENRLFKIVPQDVDGVKMPSANFAPKTGDEYIVYNVMLPDAFIGDNATKTGAEWDMFRTAVNYLYYNEDQRFIFKGELDGIWSKKNWGKIGSHIILGGCVLFTDKKFQREPVPVRITSIKDCVNNPHSPTIEISNNMVNGSFSGHINQILSKEVEFKESVKDTLVFARYRFDETKTLIEDKIKLIDDRITLFIDKIEKELPKIATEAIQISTSIVGDASLQFRFVKKMYEIPAISVTPNIIYQNNRLYAPDGFIQHNWLGVKPNENGDSAPEDRFWSVGDYESAYLSNFIDKYYLYIIAEKYSPKGSYLLAPELLRNKKNDFYYLLVGVLKSDGANSRQFNMLCLTS